MTISSNGNVGIGTTNPAHKLHIDAGTIYAATRSVVDSLSWDMGVAGSTASNADLRGKFYMWDATNSQVRFAIDSTGNVGIGTASPFSKLDVDGIIEAGDASSTSGAVGLRIKYSGATDDYMNNFGSMYSSSASLIGYGVRSSGAELGKFLSTADNANFSRGALLVGSELEYLSAAPQTTTVGDEVPLTSRFKILQNGNVGIGTASPGNILHIYDGAAGSAGTLADPDWSDSLFLQRIIPNNYQGTRILFAHGKASIGGFREDHTEDGSHHLVFYTGSNIAGVNEAMRINSAGKVGIGTTDPQEALHTVGNTRVDGNLIFNPGGNTSYVIGGLVSTMFRNNANDTSIFTILDTGSIGIGTSAPGSYKLNVMNSNTDFAQKISNSNSTSAYCLYLAMPGGHDNKTSEFIRCMTGNGNINFKVYSDGTMLSNGSALGSDDRIKHNEEEIVNAVETLSKITPKKYFKTTKLYDANHDFDLDSDGNPIDENGETVSCVIEAGVIAQEVLGVDELKFAVSPETKDEDGNVTSPYALNYNSLFTYAIAAIQEQQQLIEDLKSRIETLES